MPLFKRKDNFRENLAAQRPGLSPTPTMPAGPEVTRTALGGLPHFGRPVGPDRSGGTDPLVDAVLVDLDRVVPDPDQPRKNVEMAKIERLAENIRTYGLLTPIAIIFREALDKYMVVAGERRYRACLLAGLQEIKAVILPEDTPEDRISSLQIIENMEREDLSPIEQANGFARLKEINQCSYDLLAKQLGYSLAQVHKSVKLLELPEPVQELVEARTLAPSVAYETTRIPDPEVQTEVAERIVAENLTRAEAIEVINGSPGVKPTKAKPKEKDKPEAKVSPGPERPSTRLAEASPAKAPLPGQATFPAIEADVAAEPVGGKPIAEAIDYQAIELPSGHDVFIDFRSKLSPSEVVAVLEAALVIARQRCV